MQQIRVERSIGGRTLAIETGTFAKLAGGSVTVQYGDTVVFGAVARANPREGIDFFPLQVDYRERRAAAGHRCHDEAVGAENCTELDRIEERGHEASLTEVGPEP